MVYFFILTSSVLFAIGIQTLSIQENQVYGVLRDTQYATRNTFHESTMTDQIKIKDLLLRTIIGINEEERRNRQDVLINITLFADTLPAGASDHIDDAVNYRTITKRVIALVEGSQFFLVEKMAAEIADICLQDPRVEKVQVSVEKPGALRFARSVGVTIERGRQDD
jgi:dihydroneopterin aldolase/D-erythro-7,8-dihydroneopterin triphosphate epimerase